MEIKRILTIAGSDSGGGAGIQADIATARALDVFPLCAVTCVTSQSARGVRMIQPVDVPLLMDEIEGAYEDFTPDAVKVGMLPTPEHAEAVFRKLIELEAANVVVDPINAPTAGNAGEIANVWSNPETLKLAAEVTGLLTPNIPEALRMLAAGGVALPQDFDILNDEVDEAYFSEEERAYICRQLSCRYGFANLLLKGGHSRGFVVEDTMLVHHPRGGEIVYNFEFERTATNNTHGTGCVLSAAIASALAKGESLINAIALGEEFMHQTLERFKDVTWYDSGNGKGPVLPSIKMNNEE